MNSGGFASSIGKSDAALRITSDFSILTPLSDFKLNPDLLRVTSPLKVVAPFKKILLLPPPLKMESSSIVTSSNVNSPSPIPLPATKEVMVSFEILILSVLAVILFSFVPVSPIMVFCVDTT